MNSRFVLRLVCSALAVLVLLALATEAQDMNGPPERPKVFRNPEELRDYLKALNEYFAIVGRPRFGRSVLKRSLSAFRRGHSSYSDLDLDGYQSIRPYELEYYLNGYLKK